MSDDTLKTSLRHTHAYIDAYGVELLQGVESAFRQALENCADDEGEDEQEEYEPVSLADEPPAQEPPTAEPYSRPEPAHRAPRLQETVESSWHSRPLNEIANWHFYLPGLLTVLAAVFFLVRG